MYRQHKTHHFVTSYNHFQTDQTLGRLLRGLGLPIPERFSMLRLFGRVLAMPNGRLDWPMFMPYQDRTRRNCFYLQSINWSSLEFWLDNFYFQRIKVEIYYLWRSRMRTRVQVVCICYYFMALLRSQTCWSFIFVDQIRVSRFASYLFRFLK